MSMENEKHNLKDRLDYGSIQDTLARQRTDMSETRTSMAQERTNMAQERTDMAQERTEMAQERTDMAQERTNMAEVRTDMAFERTALSNSQTLLAYIRTAIAAFAAGIGMFEFVSHPLIIKIGIAFMAVGPVVLVAGFIHYFSVRKKMQAWTRKGDPKDN